MQVSKAVRSGQYPFVMCNFAPPDMVGHTGKYEPAIKGCEATGKSAYLAYKVYITPFFFTSGTYIPE